MAISRRRLLASAAVVSLNTALLPGSANAGICRWLVPHCRRKKPAYVSPACVFTLIGSNCQDPWKRFSATDTLILRGDFSHAMDATWTVSAYDSKLKFSWCQRNPPKLKNTLTGPELQWDVTIKLPPGVVSGTSGDLTITVSASSFSGRCMPAGGGIASIPVYYES